MQLVVEISEDTFFDLKKKQNRTEVDNAILNGTPLPKGHGDLKDQKDLAKSLYDYQWIDQLTYIEVTNRLVNTPTIIEADKESEEIDADSN